jgi:transcriptional adapter 3
LRLQLWADQDGDDKRLSGGNNTRQSSRIAATKSTSGIPSPEEEEDDIMIGDLTQRILCALIEENLVISHPPSPDSEVTEPQSDTAANADGTNSQTLPIIPVGNYSKQGMLSLEGTLFLFTAIFIHKSCISDRIRLELRSIGLLDDMEGTDPADREDDEVCAEIRNLQNQLREKMASNNERKARMMVLIRAKMKEQEAQRKQKLIDIGTEKNYQKLLQRKRKRGGRRPTPLAVPLPTEGGAT